MLLLIVARETRGVFPVISKPKCWLFKLWMVCNENVDDFAYDVHMMNKQTIEYRKKCNVFNPCVFFNLKKNC